VEQLIYVSTSRSPVRVPDAELQAILEASRRNNGRDGLTGLLIIGGRRFLQVLEGPTDRLTGTYERIAADPRHFALVRLARYSIAERSFPGWDMGHETDGPRLSAVVGELTAKVSDPMLRAQLEGFAELHSRAA
jgi:hypothetical protein